MRRRVYDVPVGESALARLEEYLSGKPPVASMAANPPKGQYVFADELDGRQVVLKAFEHRKTSHRLASFFGVSSADRYRSVSIRLKAAGVPVPEPVALLKSGRGVLPDRTIYVMRRVAGEMLYPLLPAIEADAGRIERVADGVAAIMRGLRLAGVTHRDLNVKNILVAPDDTLTLIDLDSARAHPGRGGAFERRHARDLRTFVATCHGAPRFAEAVSRRIQTLP